jgi:hypothetical protein
VLNVYTMEQVRAFEEGAHANRAAELADTATSFRAAQASDKGWKKYLDALSTAAVVKPRLRPEAAPQGISKDQAAILRKLLSGKSVRTN